MRMFAATPCVLRHTALVALGLSLAPVACGGGDGDRGGPTPLSFEGQQDFLPGFDYDSGWLPEGSPVSIRATATASGGVTVQAQATTTGDALAPVAGSGVLAVDGGLALELSARIDTMGIEYEGVVDTFAYAIDPIMQGFEPFAIDTAVPAEATLPAAELGSVPIPSVPGATLVLSIEGGQLSTVFTGACAAVGDGLAQYTGSLTTSGTIDAAATVEIEIPIVGTQSFGPFAFEVPIPASDHALDLGTRVLPDGSATDAVGPCSGAGAGTDAGDSGDAPGSASAGSTAGSSAGSSAGGSASGADTGVDTSAGNDGASSDGVDADATDAGSHGDPNYPPVGDGCPAGSVGVGIDTDFDNSVCLPPCDGDGGCPSGATGNAVASCGFNPESTYSDCNTDADCTGRQPCVDFVCQLPPSHCVLACDDSAICPDSMTCALGFCTNAS